MSPVRIRSSLNLFTLGWNLLKFGAMLPLFAADIGATPYEIGRIVIASTVPRILISSEVTVRSFLKIPARGLLRSIGPDYDRSAASARPLRA